MTKPIWTPVSWQDFCQWVQGRTLKDSYPVYDNSDLDSSATGARGALRRDSSAVRTPTDCPSGFACDYGGPMTPEEIEQALNAIRKGERRPAVRVLERGPGHVAVARSETASETFAPRPAQPVPQPPGEELVFDKGKARIFSNYSPPGYSEYTPGFVASPTVFISDE